MNEPPAPLRPERPGGGSAASLQEEGGAGEGQQENLWKLEIGRRVRVKAKVGKPAYGWGKAGKRSVGVLVEFDDDRDVVIDFPEHEGWVGRRKEVECVLESEGDTHQVEPDRGAKGMRGGIDVTDISIEDLWSGKMKRGKNVKKVKHHLIYFYTGVSF